MQIALNGEPHVIAEGATIASLIERLTLTGRRFAVEVNEEVVPRGRHAEHVLAGRRPGRDRPRHRRRIGHPWKTRGHRS